jgi:O-antigen/teichoic acid export membrane protein
MPDNPSSNKTIAKNTLLLYLRMFYGLIISLFTTRVILNALGFENYGLYNVIGSIVTMFVFLRSAMGNSTHRYITYSIGKGDSEDTQKIFSLSIMVFTGLALLIVLLCETVGLWFFYEKLNIPEGRESAAFWVYQISIITSALAVICVPYDAMIIAHERMKVFAYVQILNITLNLGIVYLVAISPFDKLIVYAFLLMLIQVMNRLIYGIYCGRHFPETKFVFVKDWKLLKEMTSFAGWSLVGNLASICYTSGLNLLLNVFFGTVINAARGIAVQVQGAIKGFVSNFQMALNPQIIKTYANGNFERMHKLIYAGSKFSFYLLYCMVLPIIIEADTILYLWLGDVPENAVLFTRLTLLVMLIDPLVGPIDRANMATGTIKTYQIVEGVSLLLILPISYFVLKLGGEPYSVFVVQLTIMYIVQILRLFIVCHKIKMSKRDYVKNVLLQILIVAIVSAIIPVITYFMIPDTIWSCFVIVILSVISVPVCAYFIGLNNNEKEFIKDKLSVVLNKVFHKKV